MPSNKRQKTAKKTTFHHNLPTRERLAKPDYSVVNGKRIKLNTVLALHNAGFIDGEAVTAAVRWLEDYIFSRYGYADWLHSVVDRDVIRGDEITFNLNRARAGAKITRISEVLGLCAHVRLQLLLVDELSFREIGKRLYPQLHITIAYKLAQGQIGLVLQQLANFYQTEHKNRLASKKTLAE